jgi:hypothetical protein
MKIRVYDEKVFQKGEELLRTMEGKQLMIKVMLSKI